MLFDISDSKWHIGLEVVKKLIINPEQVVVLAPGESYCLKKLVK